MTAVGAWGLLALAIGLEVAGTAMLKLANGFEKPAWFFGGVAAYLLCFTLFVQVLKLLPLSTAYAIWAGAGVALVVTLDIIFFAEPVSALKLCFIGMIIVGVVGLNLTR